MFSAARSLVFHFGRSGRLEAYRAAAKRGGGAERVSLSVVDESLKQTDIDMIRPSSPVCQRIDNSSEAGLADWKSAAPMQAGSPRTIAARTSCPHYGPQASCLLRTKM